MVIYACAYTYFELTVIIYYSMCVCDHFYKMRTFSIRRVRNLLLGCIWHSLEFRLFCFSVVRIETTPEPDSVRCGCFFCHNPNSNVLHK